MEKDSLIQVGKKIKEIRKRKQLSLQMVAERSNVTAGLISKIENFRTIPSLPVLLNISRALEVNMSDLVSTVSSPAAAFQLIPRQNIIQNPEKLADGIQMLEIVKNESIEQVFHSYLLNFEGKSSKQIIAMGGKNILYLIQGRLNIRINEEELILEAGDSLFFENTLSPEVWNPNSELAVMLCTRVQNRDFSEKDHR